MAIQSTPYVLQGASHGAALFRQATSSVFVEGGILAAGELLVSAQTSPNMSVKVAPGRAKVVGNSASAPNGFTWTTQGMYDVLNDASVNLTIAAADSTNPRIDVVYVGVQDAYYTGTTNTTVLAVMTGTPNASPVTPSLPANSMALATVRVDANVTSIVDTKVTNVSTLSSIIGQVKVYTTKAQLLAVTGMKEFALAAVVGDSTPTNNGFYNYTGSAWSLLTPNTWDASAIVSGTLSASRLPVVPVANGGTGASALNGYVIGNGTSAFTTKSSVPAADISGTLAVANGGTGLASMTTGFLKYNGTAVVSGQPVVASDISATEQANIAAGKIRAGGTSAGNATTIFIQSSQPTGAVTGDLWFW